MIATILLEKGFSAEFSLICSKLYGNEIIPIENINSDFLKILIELRIIAVINQRIVIFDPKITFSTWKNEIIWNNKKRNIKYRNKTIPSHLKISDIEEIESIISQQYQANRFSDSITIGTNEHQITNLICNSILFTKKELRALAIDTELTNTSSVWGIIEPKLKVGMNYSRICDINEILLHGIEVKKNDISLGVNLYVLREELLKEKIYIFDDKGLFIFEANDSSSYNNSGQLINSEYLAKIFIDKFNVYMEKSVPATVLIDRLNNYYELNCNNIVKKEHYIIYKSICDYGVFSEYQRTEIQEASELLEMKLLKEVRIVDGITIFLPEIDKTQIL